MSPALTIGLPEPTEKATQHAIKKLLKLMGLVYYDTSQPFRAKITPGVPDLLVFGPRHGFFVVEVKSPKGRQSAAQQQFASLCEAAGVPYILGGVQQVADFLNHKGIQS